MTEYRKARRKCSRPTDRHDIRYTKNSRNVRVLKPKVHSRVQNTQSVEDFCQHDDKSSCFSKDRKLGDEFSNIKHERFEVFTGVSVKCSVFWLVTLYGLVIDFNMSYKPSASMFGLLYVLIKIST